MSTNKVKQAETKEIMRSEINFACYNPRSITLEAKKKLKANIKKVGLLGGIVWNEATGNLVSGHQRVTIMDEINKYDVETRANDYPVKVEVSNLDEKAEIEQNLFMNNRGAQGEFDKEMLAEIIPDIDYHAAGFDDFDVNILGIGNVEIDNTSDILWRKEDVIDENTAKVDDMTKGSEENRDIDRSRNFYEDSVENQIARHNEVQKIKDRIIEQNGAEKDWGSLSYVVVSFDTPSERMNFMESFGYDNSTRYINGKEFLNRLEFGVE